MTGPDQRPFAERYPPWLVVIGVLFVAFIIGGALILILTNHSVDEYVQFVSGVWAGLLALVATINSLGARTAARSAESRVEALEKRSE